MIDIRNLEVRYGRRPPVLEIDRLEIGDGERVAIIGSSGAGKTTLLRAIKGYVRPTHGKVEVLGVDLRMAGRRFRREVNRRIGLIYQQFSLAPKLSVYQNVLCGRLGETNPWLSLFGRFSERDHRIAWTSVCQVGLEDQVHQRADTLSGGQQQRVAVARTLVQQPSIILADEPVSSLDPAWAEEVLDGIASAHARQNTTLVMSLHQPHWARRFAERIIGLCEGRIIFDGPPAALTDRQLKGLYRADDPFRFKQSPSGPRAASAAPA